MDPKEHLQSELKTARDSASELEGKLDQARQELLVLKAEKNQLAEVLVKPELLVYYRQDLDLFDDNCSQGTRR